MLRVARRGAVRPDARFRTPIGLARWAERAGAAARAGGRVTLRPAVAAAAPARPRRLVVAPAPRRRAGGARTATSSIPAAVSARGAGGSRCRRCSAPSALAALIIAAAGPRVGGDTVEVKQEGIAIVITIDISSSMLAEDFAPSNRLEVAQRQAVGIHPRAHGRPDRAGGVRGRGADPGAGHARLSRRRAGGDGPQDRQPRGRHRDRERPRHRGEPPPPRARQVEGGPAAHRRREQQGADRPAHRRRDGRGLRHQGVHHRGRHHRRGARFRPAGGSAASATSCCRSGSTSRCCARSPRRPAAATSARATARR